MHDQEQGDGSVVTALFKHNLWANEQLLDFCAGLSEEQLDAAAVGGFGSIRQTLAHIIRAEVSYVTRSTGRRPAQEPGMEATLAELKEATRWASAELLRLALSARQDAVVHEQSPHPSEYPLASLMLQALNHSTEHRTHIAVIITQLGLEPPDLSGWMYMVDTGQYKEDDAATQAQ